MSLGYGVFKEKAGRKYEGNWALSMRDGEGTEKWNNGDTYSGNFDTLFVFSTKSL
jgi:hypothetical protein